MHSVIEESSSTVRNSMLQNFVSCIQDAIQLCFSTAKRAHEFVPNVIIVGDSSMFTNSVDQCHYVNSLYTLENVITNGANFI